MTGQEIIELVVKMREAQKKYFTDRTGRNLQLAKDLEQRLDLAIKARGLATAPKDEPTQASLDL